MVAVAIVGGSVASAAIGGAAQSHAASSAAKSQERAAAQANATQQGFFDTTQENLQPFIQTGTGAANQIAALEGFGPTGGAGMQTTLNNLPGYQFSLQQGLKSVQNSATERGLGLSGAALKGASNYSTGLANTYYNNLLNGLQNTETVGANAAGGLATAATSTGSGIAQTDVGVGAAQGAAANQKGAAISNAVGSVPQSLITANLLQGIQGNSSKDPSNSFYGNPTDDWQGQGQLYEGLGYA